MFIFPESFSLTSGGKTSGPRASRAHLPLLLLWLALLRLTSAGSDVTAVEPEGSSAQLSSRAHSQVVTKPPLSGPRIQKTHAFIIVPAHVVTGSPSRSFRAGKLHFKENACYFARVKNTDFFFLHINRCTCTFKKISVSK